MEAASVRTSLSLRGTLPGMSVWSSSRDLEEEQAKHVADREEDEDHDRHDHGDQPHHRQEL